MQTFITELRNSDFPIGFKLGDKEIATKILAKIDTSKVSSKQIDLILKYSNHHIYQRKEYPFSLLKWALRSAKILKNQQKEITTLLLLGKACRLAYTSCDDFYYQKALHIAKKNKDAKLITNVKNSIALSYYANNQYDKAIKIFLSSITHNAKINDPFSLCVAYHSIGDCYMRMKDYDKAISFLTISNELGGVTPKLNGIKNMNISFLGEIYLHQGKLALAKTQLKKANKRILKNKFLPYLLPINYKNLGIIADKENKLNVAYKYYTKALKKVYTNTNEHHLAVKTSTLLAKLLAKQHNYKDALLLINAVYNDVILKEKDYYQSIVQKENIEFYNTCALLYKKTNNPQKSLFFKEKELKTINRLNEAAVKKNADKLGRKYQNKIALQKIKFLEFENQVYKQNLIIFILIMLVIFSVFIYGYRWQIQRAKILRNKEEIANLSLSKEKEKSKNIKAEKEITRLNLELEQRKLTTTSMLLLQKQQQIETLSSQVKNIKLLTTKNTELEKMLDNVISNTKTANKTFNWEDFQKTFEGVHKDFYKNLLKKHPNLSTNEKKLCAFLKLGMTSKDISAISLKSNRTIIVARSRLRKKIGLAKNDNLTVYINQF